MVKSDKMVRDNQHPHWEKVFAEDGELFGNEPSFAAKQAAELLKKERKTKILELGAGQGRDTIFFAQCGFHVTALEYTGIGVRTIREKARMLGLTPNIAAVCHDVRQPLPFGAETFDACYSHMLYCMAFTTRELTLLSDEVRRVLKPGGINLYTVRNTADVHFGQGIHHGENMYEIDGFIVHFFDEAKIKHLAQGFEIKEVTTFEEGDLPRTLFLVHLKKQ